MIATMIGQGKRLLELGLDQNSADMYYPYLGAGQYGDIPRVGFPIEYSGGKDIPAWSLSALLEVMPKEYEPLLRKECKWYMDAWYEYGNLIAGGCDKPLDAAYEMVCKMLERGLIKKG